MDSNRSTENATESVEGEGGATFEISGSTTITLNINSNNPNLSFSDDDKNKMKESIISVVTKMFNNGGMPDGANLPQGSKGFIQTM
jgi:hypothetical protein